jgi:two-component system, cell cycle sensor histidine kinase and response regulator CckA
MAVVLVAEDEPAIRSLASMILKSAGHEVIAASNGLEGIALYRNAPAKFDLVLTDLDMPVMDGYQLIDLVRETRPNAKIIAMSGNPSRELPAGVLFLPKPFTPQKLREYVGKL